MGPPDRYLLEKQAYWILLMASGTTTTLMTFFMAESYSPVLLARKTTRLRKETGRTDLSSQLSINMSTKNLLAKSMIRPLKVSLIIRLEM
jgi:hypothetical protein